MAGKGLNININLNGVFDEFKLSPQQVDEIKETVKSALVIEIHRNWGDAAKDGLNQTKDQYLRSLIIADDSRFAGSIVLTGTLPNMIESGVSAFDMKEGFKASTKVKFNSTGGWYLTIPFRFAVPSASGFSSVFSGVLPTEIYDLIKDGNPSTTQPTVTTPASTGKTNAKPVSRLAQGNIPQPFDELKTRPRVIATAIKKVFDAYTHKSSIYAGLQKSSKFYEVANQSSYNTFRRVGENSDPMAFVHTGLTARKFAETALSNTDDDTLVNNAVDKLLSEWGF